MTVSILLGDCLERLREQPDAYYDASMSDVPYGLGPKQPTIEELRSYLDSGTLDTGGDFMGADWSVPSIAVWREMLRVLKPGAPLLVFASSRTVDLIALGIRAGGFEIRDTIEWIYGQAMPHPATTTDKFLDAHAGVEREIIGHQVLTGNAAVSTKNKGGTYGVQVGTVPPKAIPITAPATPQAKRWAGYGQSLKPGHESVIVARKPLDGSIAENILLWDVCGLNIEACRLGDTGGTYKVEPEKYRTNGNALEGSVDGSLNGGVKASLDLGRWPSNVCVTHAPECDQIGPGPQEWDCVAHCPVAIIDVQSGDRPATLTGRADAGVAHPNPGDNGGSSSFGGGNSRVYADEGGASRYFATLAPEESVRFRYMAKVSNLERELGCEDLPLRTPGECTNREEDSAGLGPMAGAGRTGGARNHHPTLKRIPFARWLATLIKPPPRPDAPRRLLIPYRGRALRDKGNGARDLRRSGRGRGRCAMTRAVARVECGDNGDERFCSCGVYPDNPPSVPDPRKAWRHMAFCDHSSANDRSKALRTP